MRLESVTVDAETGELLIARPFFSLVLEALFELEVSLMRDERSWGKAQIVNRLWKEHAKKARTEALRRLHHHCGRSC